MLLSTESAGLSIKGLSPQLKACIARLADNRPVILARAPFAIYSNVSGGVAPILTFVFPAGALAPGDMIRATAIGTDVNNTLANANVTLGATVNQGIASFSLVGSGAIVPSGGGAPPYAWEGLILLSVGLPNVQGNYVPQTGNKTKPSQPTSVRSTGNQPNNAINFTGTGRTLVTDRSSTGGVFAGGFLLNTVAATTGSGMSSKIVPNIIDNTRPFQLDITVSDCSTVNNVITVNAGILEGL